MRLIDADALGIGKCNEEVFEEKAYARGWNSAIEIIENAHTVDAVHVVRCKDCKYLYDELDDYCCMSHRGLVRICENSFCSYGERREK